MSRVAQHYGDHGLRERVEAALQRAGLNLPPVAPAALAPLDQFHTGGIAATLALASLVPIESGMLVLDVGGGIGGAARTLAERFGCSVTVLDLTEEYCHIGARLTELTGLTGRVSFRTGDALRVPAPDQSFDLIWTQHSTMNIPDKPALYRELFRVLRQRGRLVMHEIVAGPQSPPHFPVPWATTPSHSHLLPPEQHAAAIRAAGFADQLWEDKTSESVSWFRDRPRPADGAVPPLGLHVLLGDQFQAAFENQVRNLTEDRVAVVRAVWSRPF